MPFVFLTHFETVRNFALSVDSYLCFADRLVLMSGSLPLLLLSSLLSLSSTNENFHPMLLRTILFKVVVVIVTKKTRFSLWCIPQLVVYSL